MRYKLLLGIMASMLWSAHVQCMQRSKSYHNGLNNLKEVQQQPDTAGLGLDLLKITPEQTSSFRLISAPLIVIKFEKERLKSQIALESIALKWANPRVTLRKLYVEALRNRVASERLVCCYR